MADIWDNLYHQHGITPTPAQVAPTGGDVWENLYKQHGVTPQTQPHIIPVEDQPYTPGERKFAQELQGYVDKQTLAQTPAAASPIYAGASAAANTALADLPRSALAGISSVTSGNPYADEYQRLKDIDEASYRQNRIATGFGTVAGALGVGAALPVRTATAGARALLGAGTGAAMGGVSEFADTRDPEKALQSAAIGGVVGGVASPIAEKLITAPVNAVGRAFQAKPQIPTTDELKAAGSAAYDAADAAGLVVNRTGLKGIADEVKSTLSGMAWHPKNQPKIANFVNELEKLSIGGAVPGDLNNIGVTLRGLDTTRKMLRSARLSADPEERTMASAVADTFDEYLNKLKPSDVSAGNMQEGIAALKEARSLWSSYRKADLVEEAVQNAQLRAAKKGSGGNINNDLRDEMFKILQNKKKSAAFNDAEKAQLARIIKGTSGENTLRLLGKLSPQGNGLMATIHLIGAAGSGGQTVPLAALGGGAKYLADNATKRNVEKLSQMIRARGLNIDPQDVVKAAQADRLRNFFSSIGVNLDHLRQSEAE